MSRTLKQFRARALARPEVLPLRHLPAVEEVGGEERDRLLRVLVGAEVVGAPRDGHRQAVGVVIAERDQIGASL